MRSASSFTFEPLFVVLGALLLWVYWRAWRREQASARNLIAFAAGVLLIVAALNSPLETIAIDYLVLFHLLQNVIISDWVPPLLVIGLTPAMRAAIASHGGRTFAFVTSRAWRCRCGSSAGTSSTSAASTTWHFATRGC